MKRDITKHSCAILTLFILLFDGCAIKEEQPTISTTTKISTSYELTTGLPSGNINEDINSIYAQPVNLAEYQIENPEVYAYIHIPGTNIDYPILQSLTDDNYYLKHDYQKNYTYKGSIFTQSINSKEFIDPVTVIYGHNTDKGDMFSELLYFSDKKFFDEHEFFYIYLPEHILVFRIISAHPYDKRHIMNSYDFNDVNTYLEFQQTLLNPTSIGSNVRSGINLYINNQIVVLSTCIEAKSTAASRFLVNGVLIKDVITQ